MSVWDLDNYTDPVEAAFDEIKDIATSAADAGHLIGSILKGIAPALSMVPGFGLALGPAMYAAGAVTAGDRIDDILIGSARSALPIGPVRVAYDSATSLAKDIAEGKNVFTSSVDAIRGAVATSGPQATAAFDAGIAAGRGGKIDPRAIAAGRDFALTSGGQAAAASYDAGVALAQGEDAQGVALDVARGYVRDMGGPEAAAGFDAGIALGYGKTLQEAGYTGLKTFVKGNDVQEKILNFVEKIRRARNLGEALDDVLTDDLTSEVMGALSGTGIPTAVGDEIARYTAAFGERPAWLDIPASYLAQVWSDDWNERVREELVRAAQAVMRGGSPDDDLLRHLEEIAARNKLLAEQGYAIAMSDDRSVNLRATGPEGPWKQGFDIGTAVSQGSRVWGPGQEAIRSSVDDFFFAGYNVARNLQYTLTGYRAQIAAFGTGKAALVPTASALQLANALGGKGGTAASPAPVLAAMQKDAASGSLDAMLASHSLELAKRALARQPFVDYYNTLP